MAAKLKLDVNDMVKRLMWVAVAFMVMALVISMVARKESKKVAGVNIEIAALKDGHFLITEEDVDLAIERSFGFPLDSMPIGVVDVERLEKVLNEEPFVKKVDVFVGSDNIVNIVLDQREPVVRIIDHNGLNYYLDEEGAKMPPSKNFTTRILVATGNIPPYQADYQKDKTGVLNELYEFAKILKADEFLRPMIEQVYVNNKGEFTLAPKLGKQKIFFGRYTKVADRLSRLKVFYKEVMPYKGWAKYKSIDLRYDGQVVCR